MQNSQKQAISTLVLADGSVFEGRAFGASDQEISGEVVFNTGMTGYVETLTDPSYRGQILSLTYPLVGNYGVPSSRQTSAFESSRIQAEGLIVSRYSPGHSHHASVSSLGKWLEREGIPAIEGIDTRRLTKHLRHHGTLAGRFVQRQLLPDEASEIAADLTLPQWTYERMARSVSGERRVFEGSGPTILLLDTGCKMNIVRSLQNHGARVVRVPFCSDWSADLAAADAVMLSNGPGDPRAYGPLIERLRTLLNQTRPIFGICLGHQLLALACGGETYKLKYGHRSFNQPVLDTATGRAYITSQNHGYAVKSESLPSDWKTSFTNLNDQTNEGLAHAHKPFFSVQFHPEAAAGPRDTTFLFENFLAVARATMTPLTAGEIAA